MSDGDQMLDQTVAVKVSLKNQSHTDKQADHCWMIWIDLWASSLVLSDSQCFFPGVFLAVISCLCKPPSHPLLRIYTLEQQSPSAPSWVQLYHPWLGCEEMRRRWTVVLVCLFVLNLQRCFQPVHFTKNMHFWDLILFSCSSVGF